jgi:hypothetical protein
MKWLILAIVAEACVLLCLIFAFDGAWHSLRTLRVTWDHAAVLALYVPIRAAFSWKRVSRQAGLGQYHASRHASI